MLKYNETIGAKQTHQADIKQLEKEQTHFPKRIKGMENAIKITDKEYEELLFLCEVRLLYTGLLHTRVSEEGFDDRHHVYNILLSLLIFQIFANFLQDASRANNLANFERSQMEALVQEGRLLRQKKLAKLRREVEKHKAKAAKSRDSDFEQNRSTDDQALSEKGEHTGQEKRRTRRRRREEEVNLEDFGSPTHI